MMRFFHLKYKQLLALLNNTVRHTHGLLTKPLHQDPPSAMRTMPPFKSSRIQNGISLNMAAKAMHVTPQTLDHIEHMRFGSLLMHPLFLVNILKGYARFLGLSDADIHHCLKHAKNLQQPNESVKVFNLHKAPLPAQKDPSFFILGFSICFVLGLWGFLTHAHHCESKMWIQNFSYKERIFSK